LDRSSGEVVAALTSTPWRVAMQVFRCGAIADDRSGMPAEIMATDLDEVRCSLVSLILADFGKRLRCNTTRTQQWDDGGHHPVPAMIAPLRCSPAMPPSYGDVP
jgi:hypothetical protein